MPDSEAAAKISKLGMKSDTRRPDLRVHGEGFEEWNIGRRLAAVTKYDSYVLIYAAAVEDENWRKPSFDETELQFPDRGFRVVRQWDEVLYLLTMNSCHFSMWCVKVETFGRFWKLKNETPSGPYDVLVWPKGAM